MRSRRTAVSWSTVEARRSAVAFMPAPPRPRAAGAPGAASDEQAREHEQRADPGRGRRVLAERDDPEHRGGERLGEDDRRRLAARQVAQPAREEHVGQRGRDGGQVDRHRQPAGRRQEAGPGDDQRGQQEQAGAAEAGRHDALGRLARVEHALAEHRVGGIPDAGGHGKGDAGRIDRRAAVAGEQQDADGGERRRLGPARAQPLAVDQAPEHARPRPGRCRWRPPCPPRRR